ncbi:MAG TPA: Dabb family protein [Tepidisphaeraceae bacterium]|jgi:hypothetical protein
MKTTARRLAFTLVLALVVGSLASCSKILNAPMYSKGTISHVVICYLKNHGSEVDRQKIIAASRELRSISGVYDVEVGPALASDRPIVVSDYDVALVVTFRDVEYMKKYLTHPTHQKLAKEVLEPLTSKVIVYDFTNQEY